MNSKIAIFLASIWGKLFLSKKSLFKTAFSNNCSTPKAGAKINKLLNQFQIILCVFLEKT